MDQAEFKMLIDLMATMTEAGKWAFIWWLIMSKLTAFIIGMSAICGIALVLLRGIRALKDADEDCNAMRQIANAANGMNSYHIGHSEREMAIKNILALIAADKARKP